jgi:hypothetical protein
MINLKLLIRLLILLTSIAVMIVLTYSSMDDGAGLGSLLELFNSLLIGVISLTAFIYYGLVRFKQYSIHLMVALSVLNIIIGLIIFFS